MAWAAPPRSSWTERMIALGRGLGDDGRSMVSLDPDDLRAAATTTTGLGDFGDTWWEEPFRRLCSSMDGEARLHLPGRIRARGELQVILQNRLRMVDLWRRVPAVLQQPVAAPIVVTGLGRSGTTFLHELLACDPENRPPLLWELLHTVPYEDASGDLCDDEIKLMDEMVPAFTAMHENGGRLPTECIFIFAHQFSSDMYTGLFNVAEYTIWRSGIDQAPIYEWHKKHLQTLQWVADEPTTRWVVKAPSHLSHLPLLFATYPDARVVMTHRDPLRVVGSLSDLLATLHYMHSDHVDYGVLVEFVAMGHELQMSHVAAERDEGGLPLDQIADVVYADLVKDPTGAIRRLYEGWGLPFTDDYAAALEAYLAARHHERTAGHDYSFADTGLDLAAQRALVRPYQERFGVPSEV
jgi:Sulfotransferase family